MNALETECYCLSEISINVNKLLAVLLLPVLFKPYFYLYCTLWLLVYFFTPFTDVVAIYTYIHNWPLQSFSQDY